MKLRNRLQVLVVAWVLCGAVAWAQQTTGDILGTVTDTSGAVVSGARVQVEDLGTHEQRTTQTSSSGDYVFNLLKPGDYRVTVSFTGFKTFTVSSLHLAAGDRTRVNAALAIGQATETVTVEAQPSALQTDSSVLSSTISERVTQDLPLNGRNFMQLVQLAPGANEGPPDSLTNGSKLDDRRQSAAVSVNGQSDVLNNQMIDGADNNERLIGTVGVRPSIESIAELRVQTSDYTAEVGRTGGGVVNVITKSGTNTLHGSVFEYLRNDIFDATNYDFGVKLPKSELRQNQFGASIGGPIVKDKTFFFGDYEGYRLVQGVPPQTSTVPTVFERQNCSAAGCDFSDTGGPVIPGAAIDPAGLAYFQMFPAPNLGSNQFVGSYNNIQFSHDFDVRVDHHFNPSNALFARFTYNKVYTDSPGAYPDVNVAGITLNPSFIGSGLGYANDLAYNGLFNYVHTFSGNLLLQLEAGYTRVDNESFPETDGQNPNAAFGQPNINTPISDSTGLAPVLVLGGGSLGSVIFQPLKDQDNTFQYLGSIAYTHGAHNIKIGAAVIRRQLTSFQSSFPEGFWVFVGYSGLVQGQYVSNGGRALQLVPPHLRVWEPSAYIQDDWRVTRRLTLNLGLRYDLFTPFTEIQNRISTFNPANGALQIAGQNGISDTAGIKTDHRGLSPRVGFAYNVAKGLVVRGGYGISFFPMNTTSDANLKNPPFVAASTACGFFNCVPAGLSFFAAGFPTPPVASTLATPGVSIPDAVDPNFRTSYLEQYNFTVQKDISGNVATLSYVGSVGRDLAQLILDYNAPPPNTCGSDATCYNALRPYIGVDPNLGSVGLFLTHGKSSYNALQASFERRLKAGLTLNANYQWAHDLDNSTGLSEEGAAYGPVPSQVSTMEYGNSTLDIRQRLAVLANYQLPLGKNSTGAAGALLKGWQFNVITAWSTGVPFQVTNNTTVSNTRPGSNDTDRPDQISNPVLSNPSINAFFDPSAFAAQPVGTIGSERRNQFHGPPFRHADLSLFKTFPLTERFNLEFRAECFNISNTPNFAVPNSSMPVPNTITLSNINSLAANPTRFGQITAMNFNYSPRVFQFALKLRF